MSEIEAYLNKVRNTTSERHIYNLRNELTYAKRELGKPLNKLTCKDVERYRDLLFKKELCQRSVKTKLTVLRVFEKVMKLNFKVDWKELIPKAVSNKEAIMQREVLDDSEIQLLIDNAKNLRDKTLIAVLANTGARITEILALRMKDIVIDEMGEVTVKFRQKDTHTKKHTKDVILTFAAKYLKLYIESISFEVDQLLFDIKKSATWSMLQGCAKRAGIKKQISAHSFRHTRATNLSRMAISPQVAMSVMGWKRSGMWDIYSHLRPEEGARIVADLERNGKTPQVDAVKQIELKTNLERKALEAVEEREKQAKVIEELQAKLLKVEPLLEILEDRDFVEAIRNKLDKAR